MPTFPTSLPQFVQEGGYNIVLNADSGAFFDNTYDITAKVTAKLNELSQ